MGDTCNPIASINNAHTDDHRCTVTVLTTNRDGLGDTTTWNLIWEASMAVFWKCINQGMKGTHRGLGRGLLLSVNAVAFLRSFTKSIKGTTATCSSV